MGHMPFKGLLLHILDIWALAKDFPDTKVIIDHMGFCKADNPDSEEWRELLALAELPQVYVKVCTCSHIVEAEHYFYRRTFVRSCGLILNKNCGVDEHAGQRKCTPVPNSAAAMNRRKKTKQCVHLLDTFSYCLWDPSHVYCL